MGVGAKVILADVIEAFGGFRKGQRVEVFRDGQEWVVVDGFGTAPARLTADRIGSVLRSLRGSDGRPAESITTAAQMRMAAYFHHRDARASR